MVGQHLRMMITTTGHLVDHLTHRTTSRSLIEAMATPEDIISQRVTVSLNQNGCSLDQAVKRNLWSLMKKIKMCVFNIAYVFTNLSLLHSYVTQHEKTRLMYTKYTYSYYSKYLPYCIRFSESVSCMRFLINSYINGENCGGLLCLHIKLFNFEIQKCGQILCAHKTHFLMPGHTNKAIIGVVFARVILLHVQRPLQLLLC